MLAIVAYKQPITRSSVGEIRGVNADAAIRSLVARDYLQELGREDAPGQPVLYGTTQRFLEDIGLDSLDELPDLVDHLPEDAPDEPDDVRAARALLQRGGSLSTDEDQRRARAAAAERRAEDDASMQDLTSRLEQAARSAMDQLRDAVAAREAIEEGEDPRPGPTHPDAATDRDTTDEQDDA